MTPPCFYTSPPFPSAEAQAEIRQTWVDRWAAAPGVVASVDVLFWSVDHAGDSESAWGLVRDSWSGALGEVSGSHCSCYGFEGQWEPELTTTTYLQSQQFSIAHALSSEEKAQLRIVVAALAAEERRVRTEGESP